MIDDGRRRACEAPSVTAEFRGDVCVLRCGAGPGARGRDLTDGLARCREAGVTQVVLDVDPLARFGDDEARALVSAVETFHRDGGALVVAVEDERARASLARAGLVRPPLPPPVRAGAAGAVTLPDRPHWEHEFRFAATPRSLPVARRRVAAFAEVSGLLGDELFEFSVAVAEALSNALVHGSPRGAGDEIRVRFYCYDEEVAVEVADAGGGMCATPISLPGAADTGGRGIHFMRTLCDGVQFTCDARGTHVLLVKRRR
jgi:anti-sigma regulatory factor (Ser/Thr protein kinase)/anti-anti-sigma regulatory factor